MSDLRDRLKTVIEAKGIRRFDQPVELASGRMSSEFVDIKRALCEGPDLRVACRAMIAAAGEHSIDFDAVGGLTMGADQFAYGIALLAERRWFVVRKQAKDRGTGQRIEGAVLGEGVRCLVAEDTVSSGGSLLEAVEVVREAGAEVVAATTVVDRGDLAAPKFEAIGVPYLPLLTYRDLDLAPLT